MISDNEPRIPVTEKSKIVRIMAGNLSESHKNMGIVMRGGEEMGFSVISLRRVWVMDAR